MKTSEAFWMFLPSGLEELFEMVRFERTEQAYNIWLDEKKLRSEEVSAIPILLRAAILNMS